MCIQTGERVLGKLELQGILPEQQGQIFSGQSLKMFFFLIKDAI